MRLFVRSKKIEKATPMGMKWVYIHGRPVLIADKGAGSGGSIGASKASGPGSVAPVSNIEEFRAHVKDHGGFGKGRWEETERKVGFDIVREHTISDSGKVYTIWTDTDTHYQKSGRLRIPGGTTKTVEVKLSVYDPTRNVTKHIPLYSSRAKGETREADARDMASRVKAHEMLYSNFGIKNPRNIYLDSEAERSVKYKDLRPAIKEGGIKAGALLGKPASEKPVSPTIGTGSGSSHKTPEGRAAMSAKMKEVFSDPAMKARIAEGRRKAAEAKAKALAERK
jgi:hypothetical protein